MTLHGSLHNYLELHRRQHGLSQVDLAQLIGVEQRLQMRAIEAGTKHLPFHSAIALELVFGEPISELFRGVAESAAIELRNRAEELLKSTSDAPENQSKLDLLFRLARPEELHVVPLCEEA